MDIKQLEQTIKDKISKLQLLYKEAQTLKNEIEHLKLQLKNETTSSKALTIEEKIEIFANYFKGRDDVYPYLSIDKRDTNKKYYVPACTNEWKKGICNKTMGKPCRNCQYRENKPLTLDAIKNHMYNDKTIGVYPMLEDETCYFLAFDFDDKKSELNIKEDALAFASICDQYEIPIGIEKSRSGKGIHIWIYFENKIKALTARKLGSLLLSKTMEVRDNLKIDTYDRMFPNQDFMPKGGYGNLIALPFQTTPAKYGNTIFVDRNFLPISNQFEYLKKLKKLSLDEVFEKIKVLSNETIDISNCELDIKKEIKDKKKNNFKFPKSIDVILDDMVYIDKANLSAAVKNSFKRLATFANPEFYKKQRMRMSVYNIPMIIDCSKEDEKYLKLPRGTYEYLCDLCKDQNVKINLIDKRNKGKRLNIEFNGELRDEQIQALNKMMEFDTGILHAPTGFGKTVISCKMIAERRTNTLIITHTLQLLKQWKERLTEFLNIDEIGELGGGKNSITNKVDIASIKSLWNNGKFNEIVKNYGMIIIDECHHLAAFTYENAVNTVNAKYVYGVTATPNRENGHTPIIKMQCGDIRYEVDFKNFNKNLNIPMKVYVKNTHLSFVNKDITNYTITEINNFIAKDILRSEKIIEDVKNEFKNGKNLLVLTERIEHMRYFQKKLSKLSDNIFIYHGGLTKKDFQIYDELKKKIINNNENKIIIATGSYIGEGFDDSSLDILFLTMPISGITKVTQYTGRLHRKNENKHEIIVYDYVDDNFSQTRNMFEKRRKTYERLGYNIIDKND